MKQIYQVDNRWQGLIRLEDVIKSFTDLRKTLESAFFVKRVTEFSSKGNKNFETLSLIFFQGKKSIWEIEKSVVKTRDSVSQSLPTLFVIDVSGERLFYPKIVKSTRNEIKSFMQKIVITTQKSSHGKSTLIALGRVPE